MTDKADVALAYFQALSDGRISAAADLVGEDADYRTPIAHHVGRDQVAAFLDSYHRAFSDAVYEVDNVYEDGSVVIEGVLRATHTGPLMLPEGGTLPSTGRSVKAPFVTIMEITDGKITAHRPYFDVARMRAQLMG